MVQAAEASRPFWKDDYGSGFAGRDAFFRGLNDKR